LKISRPAYFVDPVRILPYPGWFSESTTSMKHLTPKVRNKKECFETIGIFILWNIKISDVLAKTESTPLDKM